MSIFGKSKIKFEVARSFCHEWACMYRIPAPFVFEIVFSRYFGENRKIAARYLVLSVISPTSRCSPARLQHHISGSAAAVACYVHACRKSAHENRFLIFDVVLFVWQRARGRGVTVLPGIYLVYTACSLQYSF